MKRKHLQQTATLVGFTLLSLPASRATAAIILYEDFETAGEGSRYSTSGTFNDTMDDYFVRIDGTNIPSGIPSYTGWTGSGFWALEDVQTSDNPNISNAWIQFSAINVGIGTDLQFSFDLAASEGGVYDAAEDHIIIQYRAPSGSWEPIMRFENDGAAISTHLYEDLDFNQIGEGRQVTQSFQTFTSPSFISPSETIDIRIDTFMTANTESAAFDEIRLTAIPEPVTSAALTGAGILLFLLKRRFGPVKAGSPQQAEPT